MYGSLQRRRDAFCPVEFISNWLAARWRRGVVAVAPNAHLRDNCRRHIDCNVTVARGKLVSPTFPTSHRPSAIDTLVTIRLNEVFNFSLKYSSKCFVTTKSQFRKKKKIRPIEYFVFLIKLCELNVFERK